MKNMLKLALYQPDIPQNTGAAIRLCACLGIGLDIIEPCGFLWDKRKIRNSALDYFDKAEIKRHISWSHFIKNRRDEEKRRIILMTTKAATSYTEFEFIANDIILAGRESSGVPASVHEECDARITIPIQQGMRSMNVINASAMIMGEALRQIKS